MSALKFNVLHAPYYWDELAAYVEPTHWLADGSLLRAFPGLHPAHTFYGHPFAIYLTLATMYKLFGETVRLSHLFILSVSFVGLYYTYLLGKHLHNATVGVISSLLLLFSPLFFAQSGMVNGDTVVTSLGVITVYYFFKRDYRLYLLSSTLLVLSKESAAAFVVAMLIYLWAEEPDRRLLPGKLLRYGLPLLVLALFFILQKATTGYFLPNKYFNNHSFFEQSVPELLKKAKLVFNWTFLIQYKAVVVAVIAADAAVNGKKGFKREYGLLALIALFFVCTFAGIFFLPRYIMPILPFFFIIGAASTVRLFQYKRMYLVAAPVIIALFVTKMHGSGDNYGSSETDMQYLDIVTTQRAACSYVEGLPGARVLTNKPLLDALTTPPLGYVKRPVNVVSSPGDGFDILVFSRQTFDPNREELEATINQKNLVLAKRFSQRGKSVEVYTNQGHPLSGTVPCKQTSCVQ